MALRDFLPWPRRQGPIHLAHSLTTDTRVAAKEFGTSGTENFSGYIRSDDYNPLFDNWETAVPIYDKMRRTDAMVRAMLQVIKLPLLGATWQCNPASSDPVDEQIADFCNECLFDDDGMDDSWSFTLRHILLQMDFGCSLLEKVWKVDNDGFYRFKRLAPRLPKTLKEFHVNREGKLLAIVQYAPVPHGATHSRRPDGSTVYPRYGSTVSYQYLTIPAEYCALFVLEREGDNYEGRSILRTVYRNWWFKDQAYHVMGVGLDRWGVGIPIIQLQPGNSVTTGDKETFKKILEHVRANEKSYMVLPEFTEFKIMPGGSGQGTQSHFGISWIEHNDAQMARNVLANFLTMGRDPKGTLGFGSRLTDMFISSLDGIAGGIASDMKRQLVRELCDYNFDMTKRKYPDPVCLDLEQVDLESLVNILAKMSGTVITPQDDDEALLRKMLGLPLLAKPNLRKEKQKQQQQQQAQAEAAAAAAGQPPPPDPALDPNPPGDQRPPEVRDGEPPLGEDEGDGGVEPIQGVGL